MTKKSFETFDRNDWVQRAESMQFETGLFIDGTFEKAVEGGKIESINPATGDVIAVVESGTAADIDRAVASARAAWQDGRWRLMPPRERMSVLNHLADLIEAEVIVTFRYFAECIDKIEGAVTNTVADAMHFVLREPLGVVGAISPWNYPLLMAVWKVAPALSAGNCVVLKPAEQAPLSCLRLAELFIEAGGPPGVFNVINGRGPEAGKPLALHNDVAKISFTGSTAVGKQILTYAGQSNMKRVALECGGKSPQIFMADLEDLDTAVDYAIAGIFDNAGQVCNAGSRLLVHTDIHDAFIEKFTERSLKAYQPGDPLDPSTTMGPMVTHAHQKAVLSRIDRGCSEGAHIVFGGDQPPDMKPGAYVNPTLFDGVDQSMSIARDEIFGPVASEICFKDSEEAVAIANDSIYGLAASVWTQNVKTAHRLVKAIEAGVVWVNCFGDGDMTQPFGGYKQSGNARDKCFDSLLEYTQTKSAWFKLD
jgi:gamma-glutamyl-gamma-aminobutyraldehyde dehydrogenase